MALVLNLRGDLAKLGDAELAERLGAAWKAHEAAQQASKPVGLWYSRRGPIRHPWAYRLFSVSGVGAGISGQWLGFGPFLRSIAYDDMDLTLCEIKDLTDEIQRRIAQRKGKTG
jgi:hypothetical protein